MKISEFLSENFQFSVVTFSIYLNRRVFVIGLRLSNAQLYHTKLFGQMAGVSKQYRPRLGAVDQVLHCVSFIQSF